MRKDAVTLEEGRVADLSHPDNFPPFKERHRLFPAILENRNHRRILDLAAGVGYVTQRLLASYPAKVLCHDIDPSCLRLLHRTGAPTVSFDIDNGEIGFPFPSGAFDAVISLVTIEHILFVDEFVEEIRRILGAEGYLYIATPNYAAPEYLIQPVIFGRSFHNPLLSSSRYEFYAHVRYFTYRTLLDLVSSHGFALDTVYVALPGGSARYKELLARSRLKALAFQDFMWLRHHLLPASRASEPVLCFHKAGPVRAAGRIRKVIL